MSGRILWCALLMLALWAACSEGLVHSIHVENDTRGSFFIESFGFKEHGVLHLNLTDLYTDIGSAIPSNHQFGFVIQRTDTKSNRFLNDHPEECPLDLAPGEFDHHIRIEDWGQTIRDISIPRGGAGFYSVYFVNCDAAREPLSFHLDLVMSNPGPDYLSAGDDMLPSLFSAFALAYLVMLVLWVGVYLVKPAEGAQVKTIHYLMALTVFLKLASVFFHAVELHFLRQIGHPGGWTWIYLLFNLLKGMTFFVVIALIGTGWAFIKPYLSERDRNVFLVVIPLQVISNIALVIIEETSPGTRSWFAWYNILRLVDVMCCVAILLPIVGSIKHLEEATKSDGKAAKNAQKLKLFREFYLIVICYFYFTRIVVFLLDSTLYYNWGWLSVFVSEACTLAFFIVTGYNFRPVVDNPYLAVHEEELDDYTNAPQAEV